MYVYICEQCGKDHNTLSWPERWQCYGKLMEQVNKRTLPAIQPPAPCPQYERGDL